MIPAFNTSASPERNSPPGSVLEQRRVDQHQFRLLEGADQVFARRQVHRDLAADAGVDHGQQAGRDLHERHPAQPGRRDEPCHVTDHAAAQRDHRLAARQPGFGEAVVEVAHGLQRFVRLAIGNLKDHRLEPGIGQRGDQRGQMMAAHGGIGHHRASPRLEARGQDAMTGLMEQLVSDENVVAGRRTHDEWRKPGFVFRLSSCV